SRGGIRPTRNGSISATDSPLARPTTRLLTVASSGSTAGSSCTGHQRLLTRRRPTKAWGRPLGSLRWRRAFSSRPTRSLQGAAIWPGTGNTSPGLDPGKSGSSAAGVEEEPVGNAEARKRRGRRGELVDPATWDRSPVLGGHVVSAPQPGAHSPRSIEPPWAEGQPWHLRDEGPLGRRRPGDARRRRFGRARKKRG